MFGTLVCSTSCSTKGGRKPHYLRFGENKKSRFSLKIRVLRCFAFLCCGAIRNRFDFSENDNFPFRALKSDIIISSLPQVKNK